MGWNDFLVSLIFVGGSPPKIVMIDQLTDMTGSPGQDWHYLTAGAFIAVIMAFLEFLSVQRYFI